MKTRATAPGKMVLLGEYAVLFGAPALVMAVDRLAVAEVQDSTVPGIRIHAPDVSAQPCQLQWREDRWTCPDGEAAAAPFALVTGLLQGLAVGGELDPQALALELRLDTAAFFFEAADGTRDKLGLGSSAALTVALASALVAHAGRGALVEDRAAWLQRLLALHREFQHGRGSGLDVAASLYGGVIRYQLDSPHPAQPGTGRATPARWPQGLLRQAIWSGHSASTSRFLQALAAFEAAEPAAFEAQLRALRTAANEGLAAAAEGEGTLFEAVLSFETILQRLGEAAKIPIVTAEHARIREAARRAGCAYKPCGAGGGDLGLALARSPAAIAALNAALPAIGAAPVALAEHGAGLQLQRIT